MLTNAQKHDLLLQFNQYRDETYDGYLKEKETRKIEEEKTGTTKEKPATQYNKLYKSLGQNNKNKDVRRQLQEEVDMYTDN